MGPIKITSTTASAPALYGTAAARTVEAAALIASPAFSLMARAGQHAARLGLAMAPHAQRIWIAAGPGNNGGDGLVAAAALHCAGKQVWVTLSGDPDRAPTDARRAHAEALAAGVHISPEPPPFQPDICIDALLGLGQSRPPAGALAQWVRRLNASHAPVLALDIPTGLCGDTGWALGEDVVHADATLALLTLKPGLFTGQGRDVAGDIWWSALATTPPPGPLATAKLIDAALASSAMPLRRHATHKGSHGDLWIVGGAPGMGGAARLAGRAGLLAGAGRVYVAALDPQLGDDPAQPELMHRPAVDGRSAAALADATVVCGCGGGDAVRAQLPVVLFHAKRLVLDADALNAVAADPALAQALRARRARAQVTTLTPHPLEAARLAGMDVQAVQANRLGAAQQLAEHFGAVVVLKGSGTVVAAPGTLPSINSSGNAKLATAGTGDVLAGWLGGLWAQRGSAATVQDALLVAQATVWLHGRAAELAASSASGLRQPLPASQLIAAMASAVQTLG